MPGGSIKIFYMDGSTEDFVILDRDRILAGLQLFPSEHEDQFANFVRGESDAETGDIFLQLCLFWPNHLRLRQVFYKTSWFNCQLVCVAAHDERDSDPKITPVTRLESEAKQPVMYLLLGIACEEAVRLD